MKPLVVMLALVVGILGCGSKSPDLDFDEAEEEIRVGGEQGIVAGYNEPVMFQSGIGVRAVVQTRSGIQLLVISVANRTNDTVIFEPAAFRVMMPERQLFEFRPDRENLDGFPPLPLEAGESNTVSVGLGLGAPALAGRTLVFQYPPRNVFLRVPIEPVS